MHDHLLIFWVQLLVLIGAAHALGAVARRLGQPPVIGALASGLLLSGSVLGALLPEVHAWLFPADAIQQSLLQGVAWVGVGLLLVITGFETDLELVRRLGRAALIVAAGSLLLPFATGLALGFAIPDVLIGSGASKTLFALFLATALGLSSLPIIARVLSELDLMRRNFGQITLAAAATNDVVGWILLGAIAGAARSNDFAIGDLLGHFAGVAIFLLLVVGLGQRGVDALLRSAARRGSEVAGALSITILAALALGALAQLAGLESILGAFFAGILCGRSRFQSSETFGRIESLTAAFFAPLFFATVGLRADLSALATPQVALWGVLLLAAATASKFLGSMAGARVAGLHPREGFALGAALNAQGAIGLVVATVGIGAGVLTEASYTIVVLVALATSMMAPPLLRGAARRWKGSEEEIERLERERRLGSNLLVRPERILLPTHGGPNSVLAARILDLAWPEGAKVTVFTAGDDVPAADLRRVLAHFEKKPAEHVHARGDDALPAILDEASHGYGAIVVGASDRRAEGRAASSFVDRLLGASPVPVLMIRRGVDLQQQQEHEDPSFRRVLVPALATLPGRAAQEVAFGIAQRLGAEVLLAHVVTTPAVQEVRYSRNEWRPELDPTDEDGQAPWLVARRVMDEAQSRAQEIGVTTETAIRIGISAPRELLALSREAGADLIVLPASLRQLSERPFLGYGVEFLLSNSEATIVVVSLPAGWRSGG